MLSNGAADATMRAVAALTGPWTAPRPIYRPPEHNRPNVMIFAGKAHPHLTGADLVLTSATNTLAGAEVLRDTAVDYPRFVRLTKCRQPGPGSLGPRGENSAPPASDGATISAVPENRPVVATTSPRPGGPAMQKSLHLDPNKCTGCLQCEMACTWENYRSFATAKSRIKVFTFHHEGRFVPYTCTQCDEAWCMIACPVDAIQVDRATGAKIVLDATCVGCKVCTIACPFGTINYVAQTGKVQKCDLCDGKPACAASCPTGAITYIDADWTGLGKMRQWAGKTDTNVATV